jgi:hypothetical protein
MRSLTAFIIVAAITLTARSGHAGLTYDSAYCATYSDGSGYCSGSFAGFRAADASSYAEFYSGVTSATSGDAFYATYHSGNFSCVFPGSGVYDKELARAYSSPTAYFFVGWAANGLCNELDVARSSINGQ